jgi:hypothetical protein
MLVKQFLNRNDYWLYMMFLGGKHKGQNGEFSGIEKGWELGKPAVDSLILEFCLVRDLFLRNWISESKDSQLLSGSKFLSIIE